MATFAVLASAQSAAAQALLAVGDDGRVDVEFAAERPAFVLATGESVHPALLPAFTVRYEAELRVERAGSYRFWVVAEGGTAALAVGGSNLDASNTTATPLELGAGHLRFVVGFDRDGASDHPVASRALLRVEWESGDFPREPIPARAFAPLAEHADRLRAAAAIERGRGLAVERRCASCHPDGTWVASPDAPDLTAIGARTSRGWIERWLADPQAQRATATMPVVPLTAAERGDIAAFLADGRGESALPPATVPLAPPQPPPLALAAAASAATAAAGTAAAATTEIERGRGDFEAIGCSACHGARGGDLVATTSLAQKWSAAGLAEFLLDPLAIDRSGRMPALLARTGTETGEERQRAQAIARFLRSAAGEPVAPAVSAVEPSKQRELDAASGAIARGAALFERADCRRCHLLRRDDSAAAAAAPAATNHPNAPSPTSRRLVRFRELRPHLGCLDPPLEERGATSDPVARGIPLFALDSQQQADLRAFVAFFADHPDVSAAPVFELPHTLDRLGCVHCHEWNGGRPHVELAESPPPLTVVGAKMRASWLEGVLTRGARVRPWLHLRMPEFGAANVAPLVRQLAAASGVASDEGEPEPEITREAKLAGVRRLGAEGGLACIGCHDFRDYESLGSRGPGLTQMHARLRPEWFRAWLCAPARWIPGTSMPQYFDGRSAEQIDAELACLWAGLSFGEAMPAPPGVLGRAEDTGRAQPSLRPQLQRTFMRDSSPASIAVGLPGMVNYCFDTVECRVRYAWDGDFLDMRPQWAVKGEQLPLVLGKLFWCTSSSFGVRVGAPTGGAPPRFRGHRRADGLPELYYDVSTVGTDAAVDALAGGVAAGVAGRTVRVDERIEALTSSLGLLQHYRVSVCEGPIYFVAQATRGGSVTVVAVAPALPTSEIAKGVWLVAPRGPVEFVVQVAAVEERK